MATDVSAVPTEVLTKYTPSATQCAARGVCRLIIINGQTIEVSGRFSSVRGIERLIKVLEILKAIFSIVP
jgi:hypothetical protein